MHSITAKLNKAASQFQAGDSTGFGIRLGVKYRDRKTGEDDWTNYSAVVFAKSPNQVQFYQNVLVEGAVVAVSAEKLMIDSYEGKNGQVLTIDMINARLDFASAPVQSAQGGGVASYGQPQSTFAPPVAAAPAQAQQGHGFAGVHPDDIPF